MENIILYGNDNDTVIEQDFVDLLLMYINRNMRNQFKKSLIISKDPSELKTGWFCITCRINDKISRAYLPINPYWKMLKDVPEVYDERPIKDSILQVVPMLDIIRMYDSNLEDPTKK